MKYLNVKPFYSRIFLVVGIVCCFAMATKAQDATAPAKTAATAAAKPGTVAVKGAADLINTFFKKYKEEGTGPAIDYLFGTNKYFTNTAGINQLKGKLDSLRQGIGMFLGKDLIVQKNASSSLVFYSYLVKHEIQPIRFIFMFYKPQNDWVIYRFKYDDQMDIELEDAGKINSKH